MKYFVRLTVVVLTTVLLFPYSAKAQSKGFNYRTKITVRELDAVARTNYPVRLTVDTRTLVQAGKMLQSGNDIRFADSCVNVNYDFFLEGGMNTKFTTIWVLIPKLAASDSMDIYMYYGKASTSTPSSLKSVFPTAYVSSTGVTTLKGTQTHDYIHIRKTDTILVGDTTCLTLNARGVLMEGHILGVGMGHQLRKIDFATGLGLGGGGVSSSLSAGAGGGAYGGDGGDGGYDTGDGVGAGGKANGTLKGGDISIGSSGGSGISYGASGGGCVSINADYITVAGKIDVDGEDGVNNSTSTAQMGGGGSGGGIKFVSYDLSLRGTLSVKGGDGGPGADPVNDSGGGGGGGRVKGFYSGTLVNSGSVLRAGGIPGSYGGVSGEKGDAGTFHTGKVLRRISTGFRLAPEDTLAPIILGDGSVCEGDTFWAKAGGKFRSYTFYLNDVVVQTSTSNTYPFANLSALDYIKISGNFNSCISSKDSVQITINPKPSIQFAGDTTVCSGDTAWIEAFGLQTINWLDSVGTGRIIPVNPLITTYYRAEGINLKSCKTIDSFKVVANPLPNVAIVGPRDLCIGSKTDLKAQGAQDYVWNTGSMAGVITFDADTLMDVSFSLTGTDANNCISTTTAVINVHPLPVVSISADTIYCEGDSVKLEASGALTYEWSSGSMSERETFIAKSSSVITASGTDDKGCIASAQQALYVNDRPSAVIIGDTIVCENGSTKLTASGGTIYNWSTTDQTAEINVSPKNLEYYGVVVTDANGCKDSTGHQVDQIVLDASITESTNLLTANADDVDYLWLDCNRGKTGISGAKDKEFEFVRDGSYALRVSQHGCRDTSECMDVKYVGINESWARLITVFPNPSEGLFEVATNTDEVITYEIFSTTGQNIQRARFTRSAAIDLSDLPSGVYTLVLESDGKRAVKLLMRQ